MIGIAATILALAAVPSQAAPVSDDSSTPVAVTAIQATPAITLTTPPVATTTDTVAAPAAVASTTYSVSPNVGEGVISMVTRTCGSAGNWQGIAAANNIVPPAYVVRLGAVLSIDCALPQDPTPPPPLPAPAPVNNAPVQNTSVSSGGSVASLNETQTNNARIIVQVGLQKGLPARAMVIAIATALQESQLYNLANPYYSSSYNYPHQGEGYDHDSLGLFQQRPASGWGSVADIMNPWYAADVFYQHLLYFDWYDYSVTGAAQHVQVSCCPGAYAKWEGTAWDVVNALLA